MNLAGFEKIAPHLGNPLILVGFVLMLVFGIHSELIKSGLLPQVISVNDYFMIQEVVRFPFVLLYSGINKINRPLNFFLCELSRGCVHTVHKLIYSGISCWMVIMQSMKIRTFFTATFKLVNTFFESIKLVVITGIQFHVIV